MKKSVFKEGKKYTFSDYFEMPNPTEEIINELGYSYSLGVLELPQSKNCDIASVSTLKDNYYKVLPKISLESEAAKREFLIAPILFEVVKSTDSKISLEYLIEIDDRLGGYLDYLIRSKQNIVIIEAKKGDIDKGFNQLSAELIAFDKYDDESRTLIYGAVTIGELWRFSILNRKTKNITKDIHSFTIPEDVETIFKVLVGITESAN